MADNTRLNTGSGGDLIATDEISGVKHQRVKVQFGADGSATDASTTNPLPVSVLSPLDQFGALRVTERSPVLSVSAALPLSTLRNVTSVAGSATISATSSPGETELALTASGTDSATLDTRRCGHYTPGFSAEGGIGFRRPTAPTGSQSYVVGPYDGSDGFFLRESASGLSVVVSKNGSETSVARASWNGDLLDGSGASGLTLDLAAGVVLEIDFTWYGYGAIQFYFVVDSAAGQERVLAHTFSVSGVSVRNPNLPMRASASNGGTATAFLLYIGGRQYSVVGRDYSEDRITSVQRLELGSIGTTVLPLLSVRARVTTPRIQYSVEAIDIISDASLVLSMWLDTSLTGASYAGISNIATSDTLLEADTSATAQTGGLLLWSGLVASGAKNESVVSNVTPLDFGAAGAITLSARRISGTNATVSVVARFRERW